MSSEAKQFDGTNQMFNRKVWLNYNLQGRLDLQCSENTIQCYLILLANAVDMKSRMYIQYDPIFVRNNKLHQLHVYIKKKTPRKQTNMHTLSIVVGF